MNNSITTINNADGTFNKKIGKATYRVIVFSSTTSRECFHDKLLRCIKADVTVSEKAVMTS